MVFNQSSSLTTKSTSLRQTEDFENMQISIESDYKDSQIQKDSTEKKVNNQMTTNWNQHLLLNGF